MHGVPGTVGRVAPGMITVILRRIDMQNYHDHAADLLEWGRTGQSGRRDRRALTGSTRMPGCGIRGSRAGVAGAAEPGRGGKGGAAWTADDDVRALTRRQVPGFTTLSDPFVTSS
jgi:hypothetical protein